MLEVDQPVAPGTRAAWWPHSQSAPNGHGEGAIDVVVIDSRSNDAGTVLVDLEIPGQDPVVNVQWGEPSGGEAPGAVDYAVAV